MSRNNIRSLGFYTLDYIKGSKIKKHLKDIENKMGENKDNLNEISELLEYVKKKCTLLFSIDRNELISFSDN